MSAPSLLTHCGSRHDPYFPDILRPLVRTERMREHIYEWGRFAVKLIPDGYEQVPIRKLTVQITEVCISFIVQVQRCEDQPSVKHDACVGRTGGVFPSGGMS